MNATLRRAERQLTSKRRAVTRGFYRLRSDRCDGCGLNAAAHIRAGHDGAMSHLQMPRRLMIAVLGHSAISFVNDTESACAILAMTSRLGLHFPRSMPPM